MNQRITWLFAVIGLLLALAIAYFQWPRTAFNTQIPTIAAGKIETENVAEQYTLSLEYPILSGLSRSDVEAKINKEIKKNVETLGVAFAADAELVPDDLRKTFGKDARSELSMRYVVAYVDEHLLSVEFANSISSIGAAHPGNFTTTLLYDLDTGFAVPFETIFAEGFDFPSFLSLKSREQLSKKLGKSPTDAILVEGTTPTFENFKSYLLTKEGIVILFDQGQVAASAAGVQRVTIAWSELSGKVKPKYLLVK